MRFRVGSLSAFPATARALRTTLSDVACHSRHPLGFREGHGQTVRNVLKSLPDVEDFAGVPLNAPVLIVPRVFDFQLC